MQTRQRTLLVFDNGAIAAKVFLENFEHFLCAPACGVRSENRKKENKNVPQKFCERARWHAPKLISWLIPDAVVSVLRPLRCWMRMWIKLAWWWDFCDNIGERWTVADRSAVCTVVPEKCHQQLRRVHRRQMDLTTKIGNNEQSRADRRNSTARRQCTHANPGETPKTRGKKKKNANANESKQTECIQDGIGHKKVQRVWGFRGQRKGVSLPAQTKSYNAKTRKKKSLSHLRVWQQMQCKSRWVDVVRTRAFQS